MPLETYFYDQLFCGLEHMYYNYNLRQFQKRKEIQLPSMQRAWFCN